MRGYQMVLMAVSMLCAATACSANQIPWQQDILTAQQMAASQGRLVLVHFTADWCAPCQRLEKNIFSSANFAHAVTQDFVPVKINVSNAPAIAKQFNVTSWPTDVVLAPSGQELHRMVSPQDDQQYLNTLRQVAWRQRTNPGPAATANYVANGPTAPSSSITAPVANFIRGRLGLAKKSPQSNNVAPAAVPAGHPMASPTNAPASYQAPTYPNNFTNSPFADPQRNGLPSAGRQGYTAPPTYGARNGYAQPQPTAPYQGHAPQQVNGATPGYAPYYHATPSQTPTRTLPSNQGPGTAHGSQYIPSAAPAAGTVRPATTFQDTSAAPNVSFAAPHSTLQRPDLSAATNPAFVENRTATRSHATTQMIPSQAPTATNAPAPAQAPMHSSSVPASSVATSATAGQTNSQTIVNQFVSARPAAAPILVDPTKQQAVVATVADGATIRQSAPEQTQSAPKQTQLAAQDTQSTPEETLPMTPPSPTMQEPPPSPATTANEQPPQPADVRLAMDGFCPITLLKDNQWVAGHRRWGAMHRGHVYLFTSAAAQQQFLADPDSHAPLLAGYDPVAYQESGEYVCGTREFGINYQGQIVLFSSEANLEQFVAAPTQYLPAVQQALANAAMQR